MGLGTLEKIGLAIAGIYVGSMIFPETFGAATGNLIGNDPSLNAGAVSGAGFGNPVDLAGASDFSSFNIPQNLELADSALVSAGSIAGGNVASSSGGGSFLSSLQEGLTSPQGIQGLLVAGSGLATSLLAQEEKEEDREFAREDREDQQSFTAEQKGADREFSAEEALKAREFQAEQADKTRSHQAGLQGSSQKFQAEQAAKLKRFQALMASMTQKSQAFQNRSNQLSGRGGGGRSLSANVANLNQAILS